MPNRQGSETGHAGRHQRPPAAGARRGHPAAGAPATRASTFAPSNGAAMTAASVLRADPDTSSPKTVERPRRRLPSKPRGLPAACSSGGTAVWTWGGRRRPLGLAAARVSRAGE